MDLWFIKVAAIGDGEVSRTHVFNKGLSIVHGFMRNQGIKVGVAPNVKTSCFTLFFQNEENLKAFEQKALVHKLFEDYCVHSKSSNLNIAEFKGKWVIYEKYKIQSIGSLAKRHEDKRGIRDRQIAYSKNLDYFLVEPKSSGGKRFSYKYQVKNSESFLGFNPNGYGLSNPTIPFALPVVN